MSRAGQVARWQLLDDGKISGTEQFEAIAAFAGARIERIVSPAGFGPGEWYDQPHSEWVVILQGWALLRLDGETVMLKCGDAVMIPSHCVHRVEKTCPETCTIWLAVHGDGRASAHTI